MGDDGEHEKVSDFVGTMLLSLQKLGPHIEFLYEVIRTRPCKEGTMYRNFFQRPWLANGEVMGLSCGLITLVRQAPNTAP